MKTSANIAKIGRLLDILTHECSREPRPEQPAKNHDPVMSTRDTVFHEASSPCATTYRLDPRRDESWFNPFKVYAKNSSISTSVNFLRQNCTIEIETHSNTFSI